MEAVEIFRALKSETFFKQYFFYATKKLDFIDKSNNLVSLYANKQSIIEIYNADLFS